MLFEEFFKKKKISLDALQQGDPGLFSEFKSHYEQMGEKSFDHTKKFWFNKLRHHYPLPPEVKAEKLRAENQIAEQTVADTLTEPSPRNQAPELGFTPKFKTHGTPPARLVNDTPQSEPASADELPKEPSAKPAAYKPKFQAKNTQVKPAENVEVSNTEERTEASPSAPVDEQPEAPAKMGFKPRFKAGVTSSKPVEATKEQPENRRETESPADTVESKDNETTPPAKVGFKPRFKAGTTTVKPLDENPVAASEKKDVEQSEPVSETEASKGSDAPKLGFKPRFKAGVTTTKPAETESAEAPAEPEAKAENSPATEPTEKPEAPADNAPPKPAYKPRFNPNMVKRDPPKEE